MNIKDVRGVSQLIANIFLILIVISIISVLAVSINKFIDNDVLYSSQARLNCLKGAIIELTDVCYRTDVDILMMQVKNKRELVLGDFFLVNLIYENNSIQQVPTAYNTRVEPYETKWISMPYYEGTKSISVIPQIESTQFMCADDAPTFENIREC